MLTEEVCVKDFCKIFGKGRNQKTACSNINFQAKSGEVTGIIGPNGAGKSTLLKAICGYFLPSSGSITKPERSVFIPEYPDFECENQNVYEYLFFHSLLSGIKKEAVLSLVKKALSDCDLLEVAASKLSVLSKGFRQRVEVARAIVCNPSLIVMDEFSSGLDPIQIVNMKKLIKGLSKSKVFILSTHNIDYALKLCHKIYILNRGQVVAQGTADEIIGISRQQNLEAAFVKLTEGR